MKFLPSDLAHLLDLANKYEAAGALADAKANEAHEHGETAVRQREGKRAEYASQSVLILRRVVEICQRLNATPAKKPSMAKMSDADFLAFLKSEPAYRGVNIEREEGKMRAWCKANNREPSRKRLVNWLNRATNDAPMAGTVASDCKECPGLAPHKLADWRVYCESHGGIVFVTGKPFRSYPEHHRDAFNARK